MKNRQRYTCRVCSLRLPDYGGRRLCTGCKRLGQWKKRHFPKHYSGHPQPAGQEERIAHYQRRAALGLPLFEDLCR